MRLNILKETVQSLLRVLRSMHSLTAENSYDNILGGPPSIQMKTLIANAQELPCKNSETLDHHFLRHSIPVQLSPVLY